jgi:hypothetical protein
MTVALKTILARQYEARGLVEGIVLGDWSFQVGTGGVAPLDPFEVVPVDNENQALEDPVGSVRRPGRIVTTGVAATITAPDSNGLCTVSGLSSIPVITGRRLWLELSGGASDGLWQVGSTTTTTAVVYAPLATAESGLTWTLRQNCVLSPSPTSSDFYCSLLQNDALDGEDLSEIGIFCRVLRSPSDISIVGDTILYAAAHSIAKVKSADSVMNFHLCTQD